MKGKSKKEIYVMFLVLALVCSIMNVSTVSNAKKGKTYKLKALGTGKELVIADGTKYKISQIAKDTGCLILTDKSYGRVELSKLIKNKKVKWTSNSKDLKVTGSSFTAQKTGTYILTGTEKKNKAKAKSKYVVTLKAVSKNPVKDLDLSAAAYMTIRSGSDGSSVKIEDQEAVRNICAMISGAGYTFDYNLAKKGVPCGWSYAVRLYTANGEELYSIVNSIPAYYYTCDDTKRDAIYQYTGQLFQRAKEEQNIAG